jgi:putative transposase
MPNRFNPDIHHRRSIRLKHYDYSGAGAYFITVCAHNRECLFGEILNTEMHLTEYGHAIRECWEWLGNQYNTIDLDAFVIMPNHVHGIIIMRDPDGKPKPLGRIVGALKTVSAKKVNGMRDTPGSPLWQRNYYEHVIRTEDDLNRIREYITFNPARWAEDEENPNAST